MARIQEGSGSTKRNPALADADRRRRERQQQMRENRAETAVKVTPSLAPVPGRVTYPNGSFVNNPLAFPNPLQTNPMTQADGILGGQFGGNPRFDNEIVTGSSYKPAYVSPQVAPVNSSIAAIGGYKYSLRPGTGGMPGTSAMPGASQTSLIGDGSSSGSRYQDNPNWVPNDLEGNAYRLKGDYGVRGDKWKTKIVQDANGNWVKLTVPDKSRGWLKARNRAGMASALKSTQSYQQYEQSVFAQNMSWRLATG